MKKKSYFQRRNKFLASCRITCCHASTHMEPLQLQLRDGLDEDGQPLQNEAEGLLL